MAGGGQTAVVLLNLGGPDSPESVRPFLYNLFSDRLIIRLGPAFMQKPIAWMIARRRAPKSRGYYELIGGSSPLNRITREQADALAARLDNIPVEVAMRYWRPTAGDTLEGLKARGIKRVLALSLYPQYSIATTGSSEREFIDAAGKLGLEAATVPPWYGHKGYLDAMGELLARAVSEAGSEGGHVLFSAHSLPKSFIEEGDPYQEHIKATASALMEGPEFGGVPWSIGYQSRSGPVEWLGPSTEDEIARLGREGVRELVVVPVSFVSDHIETLYEIDILYKRLAGEAGMDMRRVASLNTEPAFIRALEDLVHTALSKEGWI